MADSLASESVQLALVDVVIRIEGSDPPVGTLLRLDEESVPMSEGARAVPFEGWLGLLRALSEAVRAGD